MQWLGLVLAAGCALAAGCGVAPTHVDGTFHRAPLDVHDAAFVTYESPQADGSKLSQLFLQLGDKSCGVQSPGGRLVQLGVFATAKFDAGTYTVKRDRTAAAAPQLWGTVGELDSACTLDAEQVVAGTLTLHDADDKAVHGAFDITLFDGDHLSGDFDATHCDALLQPMACQ